MMTEQAERAAMFQFLMNMRKRRLGMMKKRRFTILRRPQDYCLFYFNRYCVAILINPRRSVYESEA